jgi:hypothetical protein
MLFLCAIVGVLCSLFLVTVEGTNGGMLSRVQDAPTCCPGLLRNKMLIRRWTISYGEVQLFRGIITTRPHAMHAWHPRNACRPCPSVLPLSRAWSRQEKGRRIFQTTLQVKAQLKRNWIVACRGDAAPQSSCLGVRLRWPVCKKERPSLSISLHWRLKGGNQNWYLQVFKSMKNNQT